MFRNFSFFILFYAVFGTFADASDDGIQWILDQYQVTEAVRLIPAEGLEGWSKHYGESLPRDSKWYNQDAKLILDQRRKGDGGDLVSVKQYTNFILDFTWIATKGCNSGVKFRLKDFGKEGAKVNYSSDFGWLGCEYQILDDDNNHEGTKDQGQWSASSLYSVLKPDKTKKHLNPHGQRNEGRIVVLGNHVEHWLNGEKVLEYEIGSAAWKKALADSKYFRKDARADGFAENPSGFIMLQDHQHSIIFEKLIIREIGPEKSG